MSNNSIQSSIAPSSPTRVIPLVSPRGIEAWSVRADIAPLIALSFTLEGGSSQDPAGKEGLMQLMSRLLDEGAGAYDSDAFQEEMAARAIELSFSVSPDGLSGSLKTLLTHADKAFELLRLALLEPKFDDTAIERVRAQTLAGLRYQQNDPGVMASKAFFEAGFPGHPYGSTGAGTLESVAALTRQDIVDIHARIISRAQLKVAAVGAFDEAEIGKLLDRAFADLPASNKLNPVPRVVLANRGTRIVEDLDVPQSVIRFGCNGLAWSDPDFTAAYVLNHIFGGGVFTSRLFQEVREKRGLAYSVGTSPVSYRQAAMTWGYTATKNERVAECLEVISSEMIRLKTEGPSAEELQKAKDYLIGSYALGFDTSTKISHQLVQIAFEGLGIDYLSRRNALVAAVTLDDIHRVAERVFGDGSLLVVVAGRPEGLET